MCQTKRQSQTVTQIPSVRQQSTRQKKNCQFTERRKDRIVYNSQIHYLANRNRRKIIVTNKMAERIEAIKITLNESLNEKGKPWTKALDVAEDRTGVPRIYLVSGKCGSVATNDKFNFDLCASVCVCEWIFLFIYFSLRKSPNHQISHSRFFFLQIRSASNC